MSSYTEKVKPNMLLESDMEYNFLEKNILREIKEAEENLQKEKNVRLYRQCAFSLAGGFLALTALTSPIESAVGGAIMALYLRRNPI